MASFRHSLYRTITVDPPSQKGGCVSLTSKALSSLAAAALAEHPAISPNPQPAHITLLSKDELREHMAKTASSIGQKAASKHWGNIDVTKVYALGVVQRRGAVFISILWNAGNVWRLRNGFGIKGFHVTLSKEDRHDIQKGVAALSLPATDEPYENSGRDVIAGIPIPNDSHLDLLDHLCWNSRLNDEPASVQLEWATHTCQKYPESERGWLRLGDVAYKCEFFKLASLSYNVGLCRSTSASELGEKRRKYYLTKIASCGWHVEFGPVFLEEERVFIESTIKSGDLRNALLAPWKNMGLEYAIPEFPAERAVDTRTKYQVLLSEGTWLKIPRFFSWLVPFHLAGISTPRNAEDVSALGYACGVTHIITLTAEQPLPPEWFGAGIKNTFVPVQNYYPPTVQQMDRILRIILEEPFQEPTHAGRTLVHCGGGKGRAGTVFACYLALFGFIPPASAEFYSSGQKPPQMEANYAIEFLRKMRPGSVETEVQQKFIERYVSLAWKRYGQGIPLYGDGGIPMEPTGHPLQLIGDVSEPDFIMLVGLQGSGKSTLCKLARLRNQNMVVASGDDIIAESNGHISSASATKALEGVVGRFRKSTSGTPRNIRRVLILDRCNVTAAERKRWLSLLDGGKKVAVFFDYDHDLVRQRAENRNTHMLPPWRVGGAIKSMANQLQPPSPEEGFDGVAVIRGIDNAKELADKWFGPVGMSKFIRTKHLIDLGSATRDDLVIPPQDLVSKYLSLPVIVEEKVDGANLGLSLSSDDPPKILVQNRSHYVSPTDQAQFSLLPNWLGEHGEAIRKLLLQDETCPERYILFGEWMVAVHSIHYTELPDYFLVFDFYDRLENTFITRDVLERKLAGTGLFQVPVLFKGALTGEEHLRAFLDRQSEFTAGKVEGVVVRFSNGDRGKIVRSDFLAGNRHWSKNIMTKNRLSREKYGDI